MSFYNNRGDKVELTVAQPSPQLSFPNSTESSRFVLS